MKSSRTTGMFLMIQGTIVLKISGAFVLFMLLVFTISGLLTSLNPQYRLASSSVNQAAINVKGELLYQLMGWENHHLLTIDKNLTGSPKLANVVFSLSSNINLNDPRSLLGRELPGFYQFDGRIVVAGVGTNYTNMPIESAPPIEIMKAEREASLQNLEGLDKPADQPRRPKTCRQQGGRQVVYVYFTHNRESYLPYLQGVTDPNLAYHSQINVTKIGDQLKTSLEERGIGTTIDKTDIQGNLNKKGLTYYKSYQESRSVVQTVMASNRDLQYFIDIHRDSRRKSDTTVEINGTSYAKLAFIIGGQKSKL